MTILKCMLWVLNEMLQMNIIQTILWTIISEILPFLLKI